LTTSSQPGGPPPILALDGLGVELARAAAEVLLGDDRDLDVHAGDLRAADDHPAVAARVVGHAGHDERLVDERHVRGPGRRPLRRELAPDLVRAGQRGGVGGRLGLRAQHRSAPDFEGQRAHGEHRQQDDQQARKDLSGLAAVHRVQR
jgi:hypothetical protein